jgi:hypothetical protein
MPQPTTLDDQRLSSAVATLASIARREARLRPEHAQRYPGIEVGVWQSAAVLCDRVLAGWLIRGSPMGWRDRVLPADHFEFRGGGPEGKRPRREDR